MIVHPSRKRPYIGVSRRSHVPRRTPPSLFHNINFRVFCGAQVHNAHLTYVGVEPTVTHDPTCIVPEVLAHLAANPQES